MIWRSPHDLGNFHGPIVPRSSLASDFVKKLLVVDPDVRMTAPQALEHPWIKNHEDACSDCIDEAMVPWKAAKLTTGRSWKILEEFMWWLVKYGEITLHDMLQILFENVWGSLSRRYCLAEAACHFYEKCFKCPKVSFHGLIGDISLNCLQSSGPQWAWFLSRFEVASLCDFAKSQSFRRSGRIKFWDA